MNKRPIGFHTHEETMRDMQSRHDKTVGLVVKGFGLFGIFWILGALLSLTALGAVAYVAWHFISKFW